MREKPIIVCWICGLSKPHTDPRAIAHHKQELKAHRAALRAIREQQRSQNNA